MKKTLFISSIIGASIILWLIIGCLLALFFSTSSNFGYAVGGWCGQPYVMLLAIGLTLLFRKQLYTLVFKTTKAFKPNVAYWLIGAAIVWGAWAISVRTLYNAASRHALEQYKTTQDEILR